jgi:peptidylprolyl isomerase
MTFKKNDFVELEYTGRIKNGELFDTNIKSEAKKLNMDIETRPLLICLSQAMILSSIDDFLIGKDIGKYDLELQPEKAFGLRHKELVRTFPLSVFNAQKQIPTLGMIFYFDNVMGKVTTVSGGRVIVDFNNPLAGKVVQYTLDVKREIIDMNEKAKSLLVFVIRNEPQFRIEAGKLIVKCSKQEAKLLTMLKPRFKEILSLELEPESAEEIKNEPANAESENQNS